MALTEAGAVSHDLVTLDRVSLYLPFFPQKSRPTGLISNVGGAISRSGRQSHVVALKNVSIQLRSGDRLAILGHNGAGKTSLLRVMSGIFEPTAGTCRIVGRVSALLTSTIGMNPYNSGRESIQQAAAMYQVPAKQLAAFEKAVIEFSEIGDYVDLPMSTYSAGMRTRLGFSIVSNLDPDILIVDEVLSAGDMGFAKKAQERILDMVERSHALVVSSHSGDLMRMFCNRGLWLERGMVKMDGNFDAVWDAYYASMSSTT